jgi:hypothetical protein
MTQGTLPDTAFTARLTPPATNGVLASRRRNLWALWGVAAAVLGCAGLFVSVHSAETSGGARVIADLDRWRYHAGIVLGLGAALCLLVTAAGWQRWGTRHAPESLAARLVPLAFTAGAGAMLLGYGFMGALAVYLPGGMDEGTFPAEGLYAVFMFLDFAPFIAWWGAAFAATGIAWLALRERALPPWLGVVSALFVLVPVAVMAATGLPGFPGVVDPLWLVIVSAAVGLRRDA